MMTIADASMFTRGINLLKRVTAQFLFYGSTAKQTWLFIDLISINDDTLHPDVTPSSVHQRHRECELQHRSKCFVDRTCSSMPLMTGGTKATSGKKYMVHRHSEFLPFKRNTPLGPAVLQGTYSRSITTCI